MDEKWAALSFDDRQRLWAGEEREFRQNNGRGDRPTVWFIKVHKDRVFTRHGLLGGAMQETNYVGKLKNKGKANEISAEQDAIAEARRDVRKKWDFEGYDEYLLDGRNIDCRNENVSVQHLLTALPGSFCLYKPKTNLMDEKKLLEKARKGQAKYTLKRDGFAHWVVVDYYGNISIFSRRSRRWSDTEEPPELPDGTLDYSKAVPWSARFPHLVEAVKNLGLPNGTMMAVELVTPPGTPEDFRYLSGLTKGHTARALEDMKDRLPWFYWWDVPFFGGIDLVSTVPASYRHNLIFQHTATNPRYIQPLVTIHFGSPEEAVAYAKQHKLEGFVVLDDTEVYDDKGWNLKGKPDRPSSIAKLKPKFEDDFIALWEPDKDPTGGKFGEWGTGKHEAGKKVTLPNGQQVVHGGVGAVGLYQYNSAGELVYISKVSSGMDYDFQAKLKAKDFPMTVEVEYTERTYISDGEKTNALKFPVFLRRRDDKRPEECINERL